MSYDRMTPMQFFSAVTTEEQARQLAWRAKFAGKDFECPRCTHDTFWQYQTRPEVRQCRCCGKQVRLRPGTLWEHSKVSMLTWFRALFFMMQDKRGVSALQVQRHLGARSYGTVWKLMHKIREALRQRDERYKLKSVIEFDGAFFSGIAKEAPLKKGEATALVAVESKAWVDDRGRTKACAGFAKVEVCSESKIPAQRFADKNFTRGSLVNTDGDTSLTGIKGVDVDYRVEKDKKLLVTTWLPWVHQFIANAKTWLKGTHHAIRARYLRSYLAEHTYRFNRRHDPASLFHRGLVACATARHLSEPALFG